MAEPSLLLIEVGNSRIKWGCSCCGDLSPGMPFGYRSEPLAERLDEYWSAIPSPGGVWISNVGDAGIAAYIADWVEQRWCLQPRFAKARRVGFGVTTRYESPERFGVDRWLALVGARHHCEGTVCVVDCGTAITVDVMDESGVHLGGAIAPGLGLMVASLIERLPGLNTRVVEFRGLLGINTGSGIAAGARYAVLGLIERCMSELRMQGMDAHLVLTGGDSEMLRSELGLPFCWRPHLVLEGLQLVAEGSL